MEGGSVTVLYIAGWGRSGSTLLGNILGQVDGFFFLGESRKGAESLREDRLCGCGVPVLQCEFWTAVRRRAKSGPGEAGADELFGLGRALRSLHTLRALLPGGDRWLAARFAMHAAGSARAYQAIVAETGARVLIDSSKFPLYAHVLGLTTGLGVTVVHIVRDARAVAYSWLRRKPALHVAAGRHMPRIGAARSTLQWIAWNLDAEALGRRAPERYLRLRYEDLIARPRETLVGILDLVGRGGGHLPLVGDRSVQLTAAHSVAGNPDRLKTGVVTLQADEEWRSAMRPWDRRLVTGMAWPLLRRYGYVGGGA